MARKEVEESQTIPNIGMKQGSWYYPLSFLFITICATLISLAIAATIDILELSAGLTLLLILVMTTVIVLYIIAIIKIFIEWTKNTIAITDQEIAKSQILFLESYRRARELKPNEALYDETEWVQDLVANLKKYKPMNKPKKEK